MNFEAGARRQAPMQPVCPSPGYVPVHKNCSMKSSFILKFFIIFLIIGLTNSDDVPLTRAQKVAAVRAAHNAKLGLTEPPIKVPSLIEGLLPTEENTDVSEQESISDCELSAPKGIQYQVVKPTHKYLRGPSQVEYDTLAHQVVMYVTFFGIVLVFRAIRKYMTDNGMESVFKEILTTKDFMSQSEYYIQKTAQRTRRMREFKAAMRKSLALAQKSQRETFYRPGKTKRSRIVQQFASQSFEYSLFNLEKDFNSTVKNLIENFALLMLNLTQCKSSLGVLGVVTMYLKTIYSCSITDQIFIGARDYFKNLFDVSSFVSQSEGKFYQFIEACNAILTDWSAFKTSQFSEKILEFFAYIASSSLCAGINTLEFNILGFKVFNKALSRKKASAIDFVEVAFSTVVFLLDSGYQAFCMKGTPTEKAQRFFYGDSTHTEYESEFAFLSANILLIQTGNLADLPCTESEFEDRLCTLLSRTKDMIRLSTKSMDKTILTNRLIHLERMKITLIGYQTRGDTKIKPFTVLITGPTSVCKSRLTKQLNHAICLANGFPTDTKYISTIKSSDKFDSNVKSSDVTIIIDDVANTHANFTTENPLRPVIDIANNVPSQALKADVDSKGCVTFRNMCLFITSNLDDMGARTFSHDPASNMRRADLHIKASVQPQYQVEGSSAVDTTKIPDDDMINIWNLDCRTIKVHPRPNQAATYSYAPATYAGEELMGVNFSDILPYVITESKAHFARQKRLVENENNMSSIKFCEHGTFPDFCQYGCKKFKSQGAIFIVYSLFKYTCLFYLLAAVIKAQKFIIWLPRSYTFLDRAVIVCKRLYYGGTLVLALLLMLFQLKIVALIVLIITGSTFVATRDYVPYQMRVVDRIANHPDFLRNCLRDIRTFHYPRPMLFKALLGAFVSMSVVMAMRSFWKSFESQGSLQSVPRPMDNEKKTVWKPIVRTRLPLSRQTRTRVLDELLTVISEKVAFADFKRSDGTGARCDIFPICNTLWLVPGHMLKPGVTTVLTVTRVEPNTIGPNFEAVVNAECIYRIPGKDYALVDLPQGGPNKNMLSYLPEEELQRPFNGYLVHKSATADVNISRLSASVRTTRVSDDIVLKGHQYNLSFDTFDGLCMAPVIADARFPYIAGFHLAGIPGSRTGASAVISAADLKPAIESFNFKFLNEGTLSTEMMGVETGPLSEPSNKSPTRFLLQGCIFIYGQHAKPTRRWKSRVVTTKISKDVERVMGLPKLHGPPKNMNSYKPWQVDLNNCANTNGMMDPSLVSAAERDYEISINETLQANPQWKDMIHVYTIETAASGADGVYSVDRMPMSTSTGWPYNKPKSDFATLGEIKIEGITEVVEFDPSIINEVNRIKACYLAGDRAYPIFRANLKDEPTKLTKDKVRVFGGSSIAFSLVCRQYTQSFIRFVQNNPLALECAVGCNAYGPEWTVLVEHMNKHGPDRTIAGDYSAFDSKMGIQMTQAAFRIIYNICEWAGYDHDDLMILRGISTDICFPIYEYNGEYIGMIGTNPSGNSLTVIINSMVNSMYMRYAYYDIFWSKSGQLPPFNEVVSLLCYGDDNKMSVKEGYDEFNHTSVSESLSAINVVYTMADKQAESVPFINTSQASFLKRGAVWCDEIKAYKAPLEEASICKSLHTVCKSDYLSMDEQCAEVISNANREYFQYGREKFEKRHAQLRMIATANNLMPFLENRFPSYDELLEERLSMER